ncbi:hypothetical protein GCM10011408_27810 [Dyella caseinilytica]|nr:hypothetical protein GCM10011408_27810 [Dyella caseinilytica]
MIFAVIVFAAVCTAAQFWRTDLNWITIPLSTYLAGPGSTYVRSVYYLMAIALLAFAWVTYIATTPALRSVLGSGLFAAAGLILPIVAITELFRGTPYQALAHVTHKVTSLATFLWLSFGMLLVSSRWRRDSGMQSGSLPGVVLAWAATFVLWFQVLISVFPNGLMEKLAIVLILLWLGWAARHILAASKRGLG